MTQTQGKTQGKTQGTPQGKPQGKPHETRRCALITGGGSGIGAATAIRLAATGRPVILTGRRADRLEMSRAAVEAQGGSAVVVAGDVIDERTLKACVAAGEAFGGIEVLVANAGILGVAPLEESELDTWTRVVDTNLTGVLRCVHAVLPQMIERRRGDIILMSSIAARQTLPEAAVYSATKAGLSHFGDCLRLDLARRNKDQGGHVRVGVIHPGVVKTELFESISNEGMRAATQAFTDRVKEPLTAADIADTVAWMVEAPLHVSINDVTIRSTDMPM